MHGSAGGEGLLSRKSSGNVYDNFPCVRVGDYDLPSSMDLRQYLDEMQEVGQWEDDPDLPTIPDDEVTLPVHTPAAKHPRNTPETPQKHPRSTPEAPQKHHATSGHHIIFVSALY